MWGIECSWNFRSSGELEDFRMRTGKGKRIYWYSNMDYDNDIVWFSHYVLPNVRRAKFRTYESDDYFLYMWFLLYPAYGGYKYGCGVLYDSVILF